MDSVTQIALGATVAAALVPANHRRRALIYGAALGTLPDLDVLIRYGNPVADFTYHRSFSHSLFVLSALAPLLWALARRWDAAVRSVPWPWLLAFWLALITHPLLDAMTIYGTQLWWPWVTTPVGVGSVFIIDPLYTLPLLAAMVVAYRRPQTAGRALGWALTLSSAYLAWGMYAQAQVMRVARATLAVEGTSGQMLALPSPFNSLLWRVLVRESGGYREAYYSLLVDAAPGPWQRHSSADQWQPQLSGNPAFDRLTWFTHGYYAISEEGEHLVITDLRMGSAPAYLFRFAIARRDGTTLVPIEPIQTPSLSGLGGAASWLWRRIQTPGAEMPRSDEVLGEETAGRPSSSP